MVQHAGNVLCRLKCVDCSMIFQSWRHCWENTVTAFCRLALYIVYKQIMPRIGWYYRCFIKPLGQ